MTQPRVLNHNGFRVLCVAEVRGEFEKLNVLAERHDASIIIHTGNFGFFDSNSLGKIHESYLRHIVAFSPLVDDKVKIEVNQFSKVTPASKEDEGKIVDYVKNQRLSDLDRLLTGELRLKVPVYTIYGMIEDTSVINRFKLGIYEVPNLHLIDENTVHNIALPDGLALCLLGLGGALNVSKLFFHGTYDDSIQAELAKIAPEKQEDKFFVPTSGDPGNTWITLLQVGKLIKTVNSNYKTHPTSRKAVKLFITHSSPSKESLLEHMAIFLKADYTISNSLHFLYSSSYNELSICPNYEFFKNKFIDSKLQLIKIWKNIRSTIELITKKEDNPNKEEISELFEIALNCFDRIPISSSTLAPNSSLTIKNNHTTDTQPSVLGKNIIPLSLRNKSSLANDHVVSKRQNDSYYSAFQNLWHFNLCDLENGHLVLNIENGRFQMETFAKGFDFGFRRSDNSPDEDFEDYSYDASAIYETEDPKSDEGEQNDDSESDVTSKLAAAKSSSQRESSKSINIGDSKSLEEELPSAILADKLASDETKHNDDTLKIFINIGPIDNKKTDFSSTFDTEETSADDTTFDDALFGEKLTHGSNGKSTHRYSSSSRGSRGRNSGFRGRGSLRGRGRGNSRGRGRGSRD